MGNVSWNLDNYNYLLSTIFTSDLPYLGISYERILKLIDEQLKTLRVRRMFKQVIVLRKDLKMSMGKKCVQSSHASLGAYQKSKKSIIKQWEEEGQKKVVLEVNSRKEIVELYKTAKKLKIPCFLVKDAGLTELKPGTITTLGLGPEKEELINKITGSIRLLK